MIAQTQIGGKYDEAESSLFDLKRRLESADIKVNHPSSDHIVRTIDGRGYTFDPDTTPFFDIESDYYHSIAESDFHTVNNRFLRNLGYIGSSAALEITYAMLHDRPILLMHQPNFTSSVDPICMEIIDERADALHVYDMANMSSMAISETASFIKSQRIDYNISTDASAWILHKVEQVFEEIQTQNH